MEYIDDEGVVSFLSKYFIIDKVLAFSWVRMAGSYVELCLLDIGMNFHYACTVDDEGYFRIMGVINPKNDQEIFSNFVEEVFIKKEIIGDLPTQIGNFGFKLLNIQNLKKGLFGFLKEKFELYYDARDLLEWYSEYLDAKMENDANSVTDADRLTIIDNYLKTNLVPVDKLI